MRKLISILSLGILLLGVPRVASSMDLTGNLVASGNYAISEDVVVNNNVWFEAHDIQVNDSIKITNFGEIHGGINVCAACTMELQNVGIFDASVVLQTGAHLVQVINSDDSITNIGNSGKYDLVVRDGVGIDLNAVLSIAANANSVIFSNTTFDAGAMSGFVAPTNIELHGGTIVRFRDISNSSLLLFSDTIGDGVVYVDSPVLDRLYVFQTYKENHDIYLRVMRSTDYARILNNNMGRFLNNLRTSGVDNKLFAKLDTAETIGALNAILSRSVRTNPIKLMRPISLMNFYKMLEIMHIDDGVVFGVEPIMIHSSDIYMRGVRPSASFNISDNLHLKISGVAANLDYADDINEYTGMSLGVDIDAQYYLLYDNFLRAHVGGGKSYFNVGPVFDDGAVIKDPNGISVYASNELGHTFYIADDYKLSPFAGVGIQYISIASASDSIFYGFGGTDIGYEYKFDGLRYIYSGRIVAQTNDTYGAAIGFSVWSIIDAAGADVHIGTIYNNDFGMSFNVMLNGRFRF